MAQEDVSKIYGKPRFGLIVAVFALSIVVLLGLAWLFLRFDPLRLRSNTRHRTGMTILYQVSPSLR